MPNLNSYYEAGHLLILKQLYQIWPDNNNFR